MSLHYVPQVLDSKTVDLPYTEMHHVVNVLRYKVGEQIQITSGNGVIYLAKIISITKKECKLEVMHEYMKCKTKEYSLHLAFAPVKTSDRLEFIIEKAAELGVDEITPVITTHTERKAIHFEKLNQLLIAAMKQSKNPFLLKLNPLSSLEAFLKTPKKENTIKLIAHCYSSHKTSLQQEYQKGKDCIVLIGPEGDFTEKEIEESEHYNFKSITLGENRLRTETAAIAACAVIQSINTF